MVTPFRLQRTASAAAHNKTSQKPLLTCRFTPALDRRGQATLTHRRETPVAPLQLQNAASLPARTISAGRRGWALSRSTSARDRLRLPALQHTAAPTAHFQFLDAAIAPARTTKCWSKTPAAQLVDVGA
jgi:hypothetical protein